MDKDKQVEILEKRVKWLERKVGQLEYENHVQDEEYMSLGGTLNNERMEHAKLQKEYAKLKRIYSEMRMVRLLSINAKLIVLLMLFQNGTVLTIGGVLDHQ